jgi:hypothetical protein
MEQSLRDGEAQPSIRSDRLQSIAGVALQGVRILDVWILALRQVLQILVVLDEPVAALSARAKTEMNALHCASHTSTYRH